MMTLIELYYELGQPDEAVKLYARFSSLHPGLAEENRHLSSELRFQTRASVTVDPLAKVFWIDEEEL
jgi:hypothetical protein